MSKIISVLGVVYKNQEKTIKQLRNFSKPEFRNRLDAVVKFSKLDKLSMRKIVG